MAYPWYYLIAFIQFIKCHILLECTLTFFVSHKS